MSDDLEKDDISQEDYDARARLERLGTRSGVRTQSHGYTRFVKIMRLALPVFAVLLMFVLYIRADMDEAVIVPMQQGTDEIKPEDIARNELMNPAFESRDKNGNPYKITALRAVQEEGNKDVILLTDPKGRIEMDAGANVDISAVDGVYDQGRQEFFLRGDVTLIHSEGYRLSGEEAHIDLEGQYVWSERDVSGDGPQVAIVAKGVRANGETGEIIFNGPATLTLKQGFEGFE